MACSSSADIGIGKRLASIRQELFLSASASSWGDQASDCFAILIACVSFSFTREESVHGSLDGYRRASWNLTLWERKELIDWLPDVAGPIRLRIGLPMIRLATADRGHAVELFQQDDESEFVLHRQG